MLRKRIVLLMVAGLLVACNGGLADQQNGGPIDLFSGNGESGSGTLAGQEADVRLVVEGFGQRMQNVDVLSADVASQIQAEYGTFASQDMIEEWLDEPTRAPGREEAGTWPDRIEIYTLEQEAQDRYRVHGWVKYVNANTTPGQAVAEQAVSITVSYRDGAWVITGYAHTGAYTVLE